jgi:polysaccharide biosynthesis protein PslG
MQVYTGSRLGAVRMLLVGALVVVALLAQSCTPASAGIRANDRYFGLHAPSLGTAFPGARAGSVNLTVNGVYWPQLEPTKGHFDFSRLDALRTVARHGGAKPLLVLGQTPRYASTTPHAASVIASVPKLRLWKHYVRRVVGRYGASLDYQVWPEADISGNWTGSPKRLAHLTAAAARIIHAKAKSAVVVAPAMVLRMRYQQAFMDRFYGARVGGKRVGHFIDAVGLDPYPLEKGTPEDSLALIRTARAILHRHRVKAPVWNVEINYGVVSGGTSQAPHFSGRKQSAFVARTYLLNAAAGVRRVYWLLWGRFPTVSIQMAKTDGTGRTAAGRAFSVVRGWMLGQHVRSCARDRKTQVWTCTLVKAHRVSHVYWVRSGTAHVRAPHGSRHLAEVSGSVRPTHAGTRLLVTTSPIRIFH